MQKHKLTLQISEARMAICRLPPDATLPGWIGENGFVSLTRTPDELSIVCIEEWVPSNVEAERNWRMLKVKGPLDFSLTGILASLISPLSDAGIAIFALSTYDTDYLLLKEGNLNRAISILGRTCIIENQRNK
jgi:hypothetical protein